MTLRTARAALAIIALSLVALPAWADVTYQAWEPIQVNQAVAYVLDPYTNNMAYRYDLTFTYNDPGDGSNLWNFNWWTVGQVGQAPYNDQYFVNGFAYGNINAGWGPGWSGPGSPARPAFDPTNLDPDATRLNNEAVYGNGIPHGTAIDIRFYMSDPEPHPVLWAYNTINSGVPDQPLLYPGRFRAAGGYQGANLPPTGTVPEPGSLGLLGQ